MSVITVRIPDDLNLAIEKFCQVEDRSKSWLVKKAIKEKLEDWQDLQAGLKALKQHKKNPDFISHEQAKKILGITDEDLK